MPKKIVQRDQAERGRASRRGRRPSSGSATPCSACAALRVRLVDGERGAAGLAVEVPQGVVVVVAIAAPSDLDAARRAPGRGRRSGPVVMSSTTCVMFESSRLTSAATRPRKSVHDAVGDLEHVVHVVRDDHDAEALLREPLDEVEHLRASARRRGRRWARRAGRPWSSRGRPWRSRRSAAGRRRGSRRAAARSCTVRTERSASVLRAEQLHVRLVERPASCFDLAARGTCSGRCPGCRTRARSWYTTSMPSAAASLGPWMVTGWPSKRISPLSMRVDADDALDERRLAGAVVAHERGDLPGVDGEVDVVQHVHRAEALVDRLELEDRLRRSRCLLHRLAAILAERGGARQLGSARPPCCHVRAYSVVLLDARLGARVGELRRADVLDL